MMVGRKLWYGHTSMEHVDLRKEMRKYLFG